MVCLLNVSGHNYRINPSLLPCRRLKAARRLASYPLNTKIIPTQFEPGNDNCSLPIIIARMANRFGRTDYQAVMAGSVLVSITDHGPLTTAVLGGRPQAASLVRGDTPRNAPLCLPTVLVLPHHRGYPTVLILTSQMNLNTSRDDATCLPQCRFQ